jgi:hypothetical protein
MEIGSSHVLLVKRMSPALRRVLSHIPSGKENHHIAREIGLSEATLHAYISKIYVGLQIPNTITSRKEKRRLAGEIWDAFAKIYATNSEGHIIDAETRHFTTVAPVAPEPKPVPMIVEKPAPSEPVPHTNGASHPVIHAPRPKDTPDAAPKVTAQGYGVGITVVVPEPETVSDMRTLVLGTDTSAEELQKLIREGYLPEIVNDFQSLSGGRSITKLILVKRKS